MLSLTRITYRLYRWVSSIRYRVRRRFTRPGQAVLGGLVISGALGMDMDQTWVYQVFTFLLAGLTLSLVGSLFFRGRFSARRVLPRFGTVGQPLVYTTLVRNESARAQKGGLDLVEELADPRPGFAEFAAVLQAEGRQSRSFILSRRASQVRFERATLQAAPVPLVAAGQEVEVRSEVIPLKRGHLRFRGVRVGRPDPLGLVRAFVRLVLPQSVLVLPRRYRLPDLALPGTSEYQPGGVALASSVGESEEFVSLRDYRPGDPLRHIHWRSWARAGRPIVKEFEDEFFVRHALILDTFAAHPHSAVFEEAVSVAASFACTLPTQESLLDLLFVGPRAYCFTAGRGLAHTEHLLEILASVQVCRDKSFATLQHLVLDHVGRVSGCMCILLAWDENRWEFIGQLRRLGLPLRVLVLRESGDGAPLDPGPLRDCPEMFHVLSVGAVQEGLAKL